MDLPSGIVTFLFTDIEGSTRLWTEHAEGMEAALARHDAILREAIETNGGHVFKTMGDAFHAAFAAASGAVKAALTAQHQLLAQDWVETGPVRVRMALHTGEARAREGDYFGPPLNRCARLLSAGHGAQVLLSAATAEIVRDKLPEDVDLRDLGECRLRDLARPEHVLQLVHPDLPADLPPLRGLESFPNNLPLQATSFVGREAEMADVERLLGETRLLTVTGVGGVGKTRLALQVGADVLDAFPDGAWLVELAALSDPALVPQAVATALGVREQPDRSLLDTLVDYVRPKRLLLLLDNCEHLVTACAQLADAVVGTCPDVKILASSREGLGIAGETTYHVPSLSLPHPDEAVTARRIAACEAVGLFTDRAQSHQPAFAINDGNAEAVAQVCRRLDGIPLAIELAAARVRAMPVEQIAARLDDRFRLLTGGSRTALPRQQTLQALMDWSWHLLDEKEQTVLGRLSVFAGGWTLEAAEAVCSGDGIEKSGVLDLLATLVDKSVVAYDEAQGRYRLLETVRQYARDRLLESGDAATLRDRHRDYFVRLVPDREARPEGLSRVDWFDYLEIEYDNLRAALDRCQETEDGAEPGLRLAAALEGFWHTRVRVGEGRQRLAAMLSRAGHTRTQARAGALRAAGSLAYMQEDYDSARALTKEAIGILEELGDEREVAGTLNNLGCIVWAAGDYGAGRSYLEESLARLRELTDSSATICLDNLGALTEEEGKYAEARAILEEALALNREQGSSWSTSALGLGRLAYLEGEYQRARALFSESLTNARDTGDRRGAMYALEAFAVLSHSQAQRQRAARLCGAVDALREAIGLPLEPARRGKYRHGLAEMRAAVQEDQFATAWAEGQAMTMEEAIAYALGEGEKAGEGAEEAGSNA